MKKIFKSYIAFVLLLLGSLVGTSQVSAHQDPVGCFASGVGISLAIFRNADGTGPIVGSDTVQSAEDIFYRATLSALGGDNCNFSGGTLTITTPDGVVVDVTPVGGIPQVAVGSDFISALVPYIVSEANVNGANNIVATTNYTAGISHTGNSHDTATGSVTRNTPYQDVALTVSKTAVPAFDTECTWSITKVVDVAQHNLTTGQSGTSNYQVVVTPQCADGNATVSGSITIHNPALFANAVISGVSDVISGVGPAIVNCGVAFPHPLAPGADLVCTYSAALPNKDTRTNTATATTTGDVNGGQGTAPVDFTGVTPTATTNAQVTVTDTFAGNLGVCNAATGACPFNYSRQFTCDQDAGTHPNTATIVETGQTASASVTVVCTPVVAGQGCSPGYWKNHTGLKKQANAWTTYLTTDKVPSVFTLPGSLSSLNNNTLLDALRYGGGPGLLGGAKNLLRAAVAALLNSVHPSVNYPLSQAEVISQVNTALATQNRATMLSLASDLDTNNNLSCPL